MLKITRKPKQGRRPLQFRWFGPDDPTYRFSKWLQDRFWLLLFGCLIPVVLISVLTALAMFGDYLFGWRKP